MLGPRERCGCESAGTRRSDESPCATAAPARGGPRRHAPPCCGSGDSGRHRASREDWRRRARQCSRSIRSGKSPRCSVGACFDGSAVRLWFWGKLKASRRTRFQWSALDQRIRPSAQSGNMDVDPVLPPVDRAREVTKSSTLFWYQCIGKFFDVIGDEVMLVLQDKRLEQSDELLYPLQVALGTGQRRALECKRCHDPLDRFDDRFLRRGRHAIVALLRNRDRIKTQAQPVFQAFLRAIVLAMRQ